MIRCVALCKLIWYGVSLCLIISSDLIHTNFGQECSSSHLWSIWQWIQWMMRCVTMLYQLYRYLGCKFRQQCSRKIYGLAVFMHYNPAECLQRCFVYLHCVVCVAMIARNPVEKQIYRQLQSNFLCSLLGILIQILRWFFHRSTPKFSTDKTILQKAQAQREALSYTANDGSLCRCLKLLHGIFCQHSRDKSLFVIDRNLRQIWKF